MNLVYEISAKIRSDLSTFQDGVLPGVRLLAQRYGVSYQTMRNALCVLRTEGIVHFRRGSCILTSGAKARSGGTFRTCSAKNLAEHLGAAIESGHYAKDSLLPKTEYLSRTNSISKSTLREAFRILADKGLVHKPGRHWVAGPGPIRHIGQGHSNVVVLLIDRSDTWRMLHSHAFLAPFASVFNAECDRNRIEIHPVNLYPIERAGVFITGRSELCEHVAKLGPRYIGSLALTHPSKFMVSDWLPFLQALDRFARPVAWISFGEELSLQWRLQYRTTIAATASEVATPVGKGAAELAAQTLLGLGHRRIGLIWPRGGQPSWAERRWELFRMALDGRAQTIDIHSAGRPQGTISETHYRFLGMYGIPMVRKILAARDSPIIMPLKNKLTSTERSLISDAGWLAPVLREFRPTALVAANDVIARAVYFLLRGMEIDLPGQMSLLSFDNSETLRPLPISSIDHGMGSVGYRVLHYMLGDVSVRQDRPRVFFAIPRINHEGTLGPVGREIDRSIFNGAAVMP